MRANKPYLEVIVMIIWYADVYVQCVLKNNVTKKSRLHTLGGSKELPMTEALV